MDPNNPVVGLCVQGMQAEAAGRNTDAREFFQRAWEDASDDYEACVASHYLARHQPTPQETLRWNQECLSRANRVADERVTGFHTSLHLNIGQAYRELEEDARAHEHFALAAEHIRDVPRDQYGDWTRFAVAEGLRSSGDAAPRAGDELLADLLARLCARADLQSLALILPAYLGDLGTDEDRSRLSTALHMAHAGRRLPTREQETVSRAISLLAAPQESQRPAEL